jgi:hypothetical protein
MACWGCTTNQFRSISSAMAKSAGARLRNLKLLPSSINWTARAEICERCPLRYISRGVSYCGTPFLNQIDRDPTTDGCGCPTRDKAKSPEEHCPLNTRHLAATKSRAGCNCKWCEPAPLHQSR